MYFDNAIASIGNDGALFLESRQMYHAEYGVEPWSAGLCAYTNQNGFWQKCKKDTELTLITFRYMADIDLVMHRFISVIPAEVCKAVRDIRYLQLPMLQTAANSRYFRDLLVSTPLLAWMLMDHAINHNWSDSKIENVSQRKQTNILNEIAGQSEKSFIKLIRSIQLSEGTEKELRLILKTIRTDIKVLLQHIDKVPVSILKFLNETTVFPSPKLIHFFIEFSLLINRDSICKYSYMTKLWHDTQKLGADLHVPNVEKRMKACRNLLEIFDLHNNWIDRINDSSFETEKDVIFPEPPIPDTSAIIGVRSYADLVAEGREMEHCVSIRRDAIISGDSYVYRVLEPKRATLEIIRCSSDNDEPSTLLYHEGEAETVYFRDWVIDEFNLKNNDLPNDESWAFVKQWVDDYYSGLREIEDPELYRNSKWGRW